MAAHCSCSPLIENSTKRRHGHDKNASITKNKHQTASITDRLRKYASEGRLHCPIALSRTSDSTQNADRGHRFCEDRYSGENHVEDYQNDHYRSGAGSSNHQSHARIKHERYRDRRGHSEDHVYDPCRRIKVEPGTENRLSEQPEQRGRNDERRQNAYHERVHDGVDTNFGRRTVKEEADAVPEKEKPNYQVSGKLAEDTNTFRGVVIKYNEPAEARKPKRHWRLYGFKGDDALPMLPIHRQSAYLLGRDRRVADIPIDHPSCSKQHAVLQYRLIDYTRPGGTLGRKVRPYIIDLGSANGTYINNQRIEAQRYMELFERDLIKFGFSTREYVLLHENVDTSELVIDSEWLFSMWMTYNCLID